MGIEAVDESEIFRDTSNAVASQGALDAWLATQSDLDPSQPSLLPGWTIGHVLTHLARNADGAVRMLDGRAQYPHGVDGRNHDIEVGAGRSMSELIDDVATTSAALARRWQQQTEWAGVGESLGGPRPLAMLPFLRQREVELHRIDIGLGYTFDDLPAEYLRRELRLLEMVWKSRHPMGMSRLPDEVLHTPPPTRLAWFTGRVEIDGVAPANCF